MKTAAAFALTLLSLGCGPAQIEGPQVTADASGDDDGDVPLPGDGDEATGWHRPALPPVGELVAPPPQEAPDEPPPPPPPPDPPPDETEEPLPPDVPPPPACAEAALPPVPADCPFVNELVIYGQEGWNVLGDALAPSLSPCTEAFISIPPQYADKTLLRANQAAMMRARGPRLHAMAEFHFATWNAKRIAEGLSWREMGLLFRDEMEAKGFCVAAGDTWAVDEAPSTLRRDATFRANFADLLDGLAEGRPGMPHAKGALFLAGFGQQSATLGTYKANLKDTLADAAFFNRINDSVRFYAHETYVDPSFSCVPDSAVADRRRRVNQFAMHTHRLSVLAPDGAGADTAQSYLGRAYVPLLNAVWDASADRGYGDTTIAMDNMKRFIRMQVDAVRTYASANAAPDGRIGFAFASYHTPDEWQQIGETLASAIAGAYGEGGTADGACGDESCSCSVAGADENTAWQIFQTW